MKNNLIGALVGGATLFISGYIIYLLIFPSPEFVMGEGPNEGFRENDIIPLIILMEVLFGLLITLIFTRWAGITTFKSGMSAGAWIGLLLGLTFGLWTYSTTTLFSSNIIIYYALTFAIRFALAGGAVGWVLGMVKESGTLKVASST